MRAVRADPEACRCCWGRAGGTLVRAAAAVVLLGILLLLLSLVDQGVAEARQLAAPARVDPGRALTAQLPPGRPPVEGLARWKQARSLLTLTSRPLLGAPATTGAADSPVGGVTASAGPTTAPASDDPGNPSGELPAPELEHMTGTRHGSAPEDPRPTEPDANPAGSDPRRRRGAVVGDPAVDSYDPPTFPAPRPRPPETFAPVLRDKAARLHELADDLDRRFEANGKKIEESIERKSTPGGEPDGSAVFDEATRELEQLNEESDALRHAIILLHLEQDSLPTTDPEGGVDQRQFQQRQFQQRQDADEEQPLLLRRPRTPLPPADPDEPIGMLDGEDSAPTGPASAGLAPLEDSTPLEPVEVLVDEGVRETFRPQLDAGEAGVTDTFDAEPGDGAVLDAGLELGGELLGSAPV